MTVEIAQHTAPRKLLTIYRYQANAISLISAVQINSYSYTSTLTTHLFQL